MDNYWLSIMVFFKRYMSKWTNLMINFTHSQSYKFISSLSDKCKNYPFHYWTPCIITTFYPMQRLKKTGYFEKCPRKEKEKKTNLRPFHSGWNEISILWTHGGKGNSTKIFFFLKHLLIFRLRNNWNDL